MQQNNHDAAVKAADHPPHLQTPLSCADANAAAFPGKKDIALTSDPAETGAAALFCFNKSNCKLWTAGDNAACMESVNFDVVIAACMERGDCEGD